MPNKKIRMDGRNSKRVPAPHFLGHGDTGVSVAEPTLSDAASVGSVEDDLGSGCHEASHLTELHVRRHLMKQSGLSFSSLVVRRMENGLCLQGVVESCDDEPDFDHLVREVAAVENVVSQVVVRPRKG